MRSPPPVTTAITSTAPRWSRRRGRRLHPMKRLNTMRSSVRLLFTGAIAMLAAGCHESFAPVGDTTVLSVVPAGGTTNVDPAGPIVIEFSHAMRMGMEQYAALHEGDVTGPVVQGTWSWSSDGLRLTFTPTAPLKPGRQYALHLGGGMLDANGHL